MTFWNALAAGGALWFAFDMASLQIDPKDIYRKMMAQRVTAGLVDVIGFGLCLWGAIP